ncbi:hypothetical protein BDP27DRAFT_913301 [Rhodocollybia butyracea]|uniref:Uncharacterized protein n=1 Tax=Rhodocollybia butyracea TaxID=206335 RepID=A0A9P5U647_9AGAR|nr:hypothetical protein BDP27DRAFT_913301 [Rhodocollybia butyracea]
MYITSRGARNHRVQYLAAGTCTFQTCSRLIRIPVSYLIKLLQDTYDADTPFRNPQMAVHHWLLIQLLNVIGSYTVI